MSGDFDAIIIGGGHNGLVAAATLARAGRRVALLEQREILGGAAATEDLFPGFRVDSGSTDAGLFQPQIAQFLNLKKHGLTWIETPAPVHALHPDGRGLTLWRDPARSAAELESWSRSDARSYPAFADAVAEMSAALRQALLLLPPDLRSALRWRQWLPWLQLGWKQWRRGPQRLSRLLRSLPMPIADLLDEWFETPRLQGALAAGAVSGLALGPHGAGTGLQFLYQNSGVDGGGARSTRYVRGGIGALSKVLAASARAHGAEIRLESPVRRILIDDDGAVEGIELENGDRLSSKTLLSAADPHHTLMDLIGAPNLPLEVVRHTQNIRFRGVIARLILALEGLPAIAGEPEVERLRGHLVLCPDLNYLERAYDDSKYGRLTTNPLLDIQIPTLNDPSLAPEGRHVMCINAQYLPELETPQSWREFESELEMRILEALASVMPGLSDRILHSRLLSPADWAATYGLPQGDIHHGQMALDQWFVLRPFGGHARYRAPVQGLYFAAAGAYPGGGVSGAPGYNAARQALKDLRSGRRD
jgi:phytoene dehydrogenase-like protein